MKKLFIFTFIFSSIFLASCSKKEVNENITNSNSWQVLIQTWIELKSQTWVENTTQTWIIQDEKIENTELTENKIQTQISKNNKELIKEKDWNIYLYESWIKKYELTTYASNCIDAPECMSSINYDIIQSKWNYGIVYKKEQWWECSEKTFYWYDMNKNNDLLTELYKTWDCFLSLKWKVNWNNLEVYVEFPEYVVDNVENKWEISKGFLKKEWFSKVWNDWIKTINLKDKIKQETKIENVKNIETPKVEVVKLDAKYSNENLIKNWYKLNNLWNIKEYYKEDLIPEKLDTDGVLINRWYSSWKTIYIEWNNVLDFEINSDWWQNLIINNPKTTEIVDLSQFWYPIQAIFWWNLPQIIISDLNNIKIKKEDLTSQTLWSRK